MQLTHEQIGWFISAAAWWAAQVPIVKALIFLIGIDIATGWLLAISKRTLNSTTSFQGMCKKVSVMLFVAVGVIIEPFANGLPLSVIFATGFLIQELLSIVENMAALGVKFPQGILDVLEKFQDGKKSRLEQKARPTSALVQAQANGAALAEIKEQIDSRSAEIIESVPKESVVIIHPPAL